MTYHYLKITLIGLTLWISSFSHASVISTTFDSDNYYGGNMFDLTTFNNALLITEAEVHLRTGGSIALVSLYTRMGSYKEYERTPEAWTLQGQEEVTSKGNGAPTPLNFADFVVEANTLYGFYFSVSEYRNRAVYMNYTNGANSYANSDLSIDLGVGRGIGDFTSPVFSPRTWNGSLTYEIVPTVSSRSYIEVPSPTTLTLFALTILGVGLYRGIYRVNKTQ